ncbi:hypothetical protein [Azotobacter vinelandii]
MLEDKRDEPRLLINAQNCVRYI